MTNSTPGNSPGKRSSWAPESSFEQSLTQTICLVMPAGTGASTTIPTILWTVAASLYTGITMESFWPAGVMTSAGADEGSEVVVVMVLAFAKPDAADVPDNARRARHDKRNRADGPPHAPVGSCYPTRWAYGDT